VNEHEAPRQPVSVLNLAEDRLGDEHGEQETPEAHYARVAHAQLPDEPTDHQNSDPECGGDAHVDVDRLRDRDAEALDLVARPGMRP